MIDIEIVKQGEVNPIFNKHPPKINSSKLWSTRRLSVNLDFLINYILSLCITTNRLFIFVQHCKNTYRVISYSLSLLSLSEYAPSRLRDDDPFCVATGFGAVVGSTGVFESVCEVGALVVA